MGKSIEVAFTVSRDELFEAARAKFFPQPWRGTLLTASSFLVLLTVATLPSGFGFVFLLAATYLVLLGLFLWFAMPRRVERRWPLAGIEQRLTITAKGITFATGETSAVLDWKAAKTPRLTRHVLVISLGRSSMLVLPKRAFDAQQLVEMQAFVHQARDEAVAAVKARMKQRSR